MAVKTAKGIKGIRKFLNPNNEGGKFGWHVFTENTYEGFSEVSALATIHEWNAKGYILTGFTGNGLTFSKSI